MITLELAVEHGLEHVTTEAISAAAGVSTRTFFNYYTNKETAAIGMPPAFKEEDLEALRTGTGALAPDLKQFLDKHVEVLTGDEDIIKMIGTVLRANEKARGILEGFLIMQRQQLTECLSNRVTNRQTASALASSLTDTVGRTIFLWEETENMSLAAALDITWDGLTEASQLLASG